ncbi:MAG: hypothetical protein IT210_11815 [Armatimonadetes bacterium]|nr:hypothetical protein [Armatimonadota bacterium]
MTGQDIINTTKPILFETSLEEFPYGLVGTCYPVKYNGSLYIVSAFHCYSKYELKPEQTCYPRPDDPTDFFAFDRCARFKAEHAMDDEHYDHIALRVSQSHHSQGEMDKVAALDLANPDNARPPESNDIIDFVLRGYPAPMQKIDYDLKKISYQAYMTNGCLGVAKAPFDLCYSIRMKTPIPDNMDPKGMSGTPLYGINHNRKIVYCGMLIQYGEFTGEYIAIGPEILVNGLKEL